MSLEKTFEGDTPQRVNKWLAQSGVCSRREAEALIAEGAITIDGTPVQDLGHKINPGETLRLNKKGQARLDSKMTVVLHKPLGIVSGTPEEGQIPAVRLLKEENLSGRTHIMPGFQHKFAPLGRLDMDSRGLLILSEDGVLAKALIGPDSKLVKHYLVRVRGEITDAKLIKLRHGLELDNRKLRPAKVSVASGQVLRFALQEGRNRQIRRMCDLVDLRVTDLLRTQIGPLKLAGLPEGKWRPLSGKDRGMLIRAAKGEKARMPPRGARDFPKPGRP